MHQGFKCNNWCKRFQTFTKQRRSFDKLLCSTVSNQKQNFVSGSISSYRSRDMRVSIETPSRFRSECSCFWLLLVLCGGSCLWLRVDSCREPGHRSVPVLDVHLCQGRQFVLCQKSNLGQFFNDFNFSLTEENRRQISLQFTDLKAISSLLRFSRNASFSLSILCHLEISKGPSIHI